VSVRFSGVAFVVEGGCSFAGLGAEGFSRDAFRVSAFRRSRSWANVSLAGAVVAASVKLRPRRTSIPRGATVCRFMKHSREGDDD
jgi:hypothetical protein